MLKVIFFFGVIQGLLVSLPEVHAARVPLQFDLLGQGPVDLRGPFLTYRLGKDSLNLGGVVLDSQSLGVEMRYPTQGKDSKMLLRKPQGWISGSFQLELRDIVGNIVWSRDVEKGDEPKIEVPFEPMQLPLQPLKLFLVSSHSLNTLVVCLGEYEWRTNRLGQWVMTPVVRPQTENEVLVDGQPVSREGEIQVTPAGLRFFANFGNGRTLQIFTQPDPLVIHDIVEIKKGVMRITGQGVKPFGSVQDLNPSQEGFLVNFFKWQQTIGDFRQFWQLDLSLLKPKLERPGPFGEVLSYEFIVKSLPRESERVFLEEDSPKGTYVNNAKLFGKVPRVFKLSTQENSVDQDSDGEFVWSFRAEERGKLNRAKMFIERRGQKFPLAYELYKGYPRELSARISGVYGSNDAILFVGEAAFNYWFEDLMGWNNYYLGRHRWGLSLKGFRSLNALRVEPRSGAIQYLTADLKYRMAPGLWGRDESWGLIAGIQRVKFNLFQSDQQGFGLFWARSMPRLFDEWMNLFPFMDYPKWVDMEFIYYPRLSGENVESLNPPQGQGNWSLNFHGKVLWTDRFFGEAGFGMKQLHWRQKVLDFKFTSFYATAGLGINF